MPATDRQADIKDSILDTIGETPLVRLSRIGAGLTPQLVAKLELFNPGGSIKDRVAMRLVQAPPQDRPLQPAGTLIAPPGGDTGTGLASPPRRDGYGVPAARPATTARDESDHPGGYAA